MSRNGRVEVARLIWYPLIVLTLIVVARSSFFDNWTWPTSLIVIFAITAAWAVGSAILLKARRRTIALASAERPAAFSFVRPAQ